MVKAIDIYIDQVHAGKEVEAAQFVEDKQKEEFIRSQQHKLAKKSRARRSSADQEITTGGGTSASIERIR